MKNCCIIITGPTAVGKSSIALELAREYNTEIISADSRQCFKELNIGVAKPPLDELEEIKHYFINIHSISDSVSAADYENFALNAADFIFSKNRVAIMVGGTGLYIKAFCDGLDPIPPADEKIRAEIINEYNKQGITWLQDQIKKQDPAFYGRGEMSNPQRLMRALEVVQATDKSILSYQHGTKKTRPFDIIKIGLEIPKKELYVRINERVEKMMKDGLLAEAESLYPYKSLNALQTVGYKELFDYFDKHCSLEEAVSMIKQNTRHYAKRQMTWFKKDAAIKWFRPDQKLLSAYLKQATFN